jgi:hypothetical protein
MTTASPNRGFERLLLQFYGPADVADPDAPPREVVLAPDICPRCGFDRNTEHVVTRDPVFGSVMRCPVPEDA